MDAADRKPPDDALNKLFGGHTHAWGIDLNTQPYKDERARNFGLRENFASSTLAAYTFHNGPQIAAIPHLTPMICPVTQSASSETKKATTSAMSLGGGEN